MKYRISTDDQLAACFRRIKALQRPEQGWLLTFEPYVHEHTDAQRALLWVTWMHMATELREQTGTDWNAQLVHDAVLGAVYGFREVTMARLTVEGEVYTEICAKPIKTMTTLAGKPRRMSRDEMSDVIEQTNRFASEHMIGARMAA